MFCLWCFPISCRIYIGYNIGGKNFDIISNGPFIHSFHHSISWPCDVMYGQHNIGTLKLHYLNYLNKRSTIRSTIFSCILHLSIFSYHLCPHLPSTLIITLLPLPPHTQSLPALFILSKVLPYSAKCRLFEDQTSSSRFYQSNMYKEARCKPVCTELTLESSGVIYLFFLGAELTSVLSSGFFFICYVVRGNCSLQLLLFVEFLHSFHISIKSYVN